MYDKKTIIISILLISLLYTNKEYLIKISNYAKKYLFPEKTKPINVELVLVKENQSIIKGYIEADINKKMKDDKLKEILLYSFVGGKNVRPIILLSIFKKLTSNKIPEYIKLAAISIEYIHAASLVIDDMMDGDYYRRDNLSVFAKYGVAMAQLAALILCSYSGINIFKSLEILSDENPDMNKHLPLLVGSFLSENIALLGQGQFVDITNDTSDITKIGKSTKHKIGKYNIDQLIKMKTSTLFEYCFVIPYIYANCNSSREDLKEKVREMQYIAQLFGFLFQVADDFEDAEKDEARNGKNNSGNYVVEHGHKKAAKKYFATLDEFRVMSKKHNIDTEEINEIINYLNEKVKVYNI